MKRNGFSVTIVMMVLLCVAGQAEAQYPVLSPVPDVAHTRPNLGSCTCPVDYKLCIPPGRVCQGTIDQKVKTDIKSCKLDVLATAREGKPSCKAQETEKVVCSRGKTVECKGASKRTIIGDRCEWVESLGKCTVIHKEVTVKCNSDAPFKGQDGYEVERPCGPCRTDSECTKQKCSVKKKVAAGTNKAQPCTQTVPEKLSCNFTPD